MIVKDFVAEVECVVCKKVYKFFVPKRVWEKYLEQETEGRTVKELFPHLLDSDVQLIETLICENCE